MEIIPNILLEIEPLGRNLGTTPPVQTEPGPALDRNLNSLSLFSLLGALGSPSICPQTHYSMVRTARNRTFPSIIASVGRTTGQRK